MKKLEWVGKDSWVTSGHFFLFLSPLGRINKNIWRQRETRKNEKRWQSNAKKKKNMGGGKANEREKESDLEGKRRKKKDTIKWKFMYR